MAVTGSGRARGDVEMVSARRGWINCFLGDGIMSASVFAVIDVVARVLVCRLIAVWINASCFFFSDEEAALGPLCWCAGTRFGVDDVGVLFVTPPLLSPEIAVSACDESVSSRRCLKRLADNDGGGRDDCKSGAAHKTDPGGFLGESDSSEGRSAAMPGRDSPGEKGDFVGLVLLLRSCVRGLIN